MTTEEMKTIFEEVVKSGVVLHGQYNQGNKKTDYMPGSRYNVQYVEERRLCHVTLHSGRNCGFFTIANVIQWFFENWWKIDDVFVDEWLERYLVPETISDVVEDLL